MGFEGKSTGHQASDPYGPRESTPWEPYDCKVRNLTVFVILMLVTLGFYWFYVVYYSPS